MKQSIFIVLALCAILALAGCGPAQNPTQTDPFIGGTKGIVMAFMPGAPPAEVYDGGKLPFTVNVQLDNQGESDVGIDATNSNDHFALVQIIGINPAQLGYPETDKTFEQEGITLSGARRLSDGSIITGAKNIITFDGYNYLPDEAGNTQRDLRANICYDYSTRTTTVVCIKDKVLENIQDSSICTLGGVKEVKNSGAPVHITSVSEQPGGQNKIFVTFTIENVGTGDIFRRSTTQLLSSNNPCDTSLTNPNRNWVHVKVSLGDDTTTNLIQCPQMGNSNEGDIQMFQGAAATMTCTIQTNPQNNQIYTDSLRINLEYTYHDFIQTQLLVRHYSAG